ncbi:unnamed protein product [Ilex paraguariensis]|uniref:Uncharacterized protein n=1 Tax=Ilex paraguariensis TaxID=185542 RepID=A0ABC8UX47_9AQUA
MTFLTRVLKAGVTSQVGVTSQAVKHKRFSTNPSVILNFGFILGWFCYKKRAWGSIALPLTEEYLSKGSLFLQFLIRFWWS